MDTRLMLVSCFLCSGIALAARGDPPAKVNAPEPAPQKATLASTDLEQLALENNPTLRQAAAQIEAARARVQQAGLYPNPTVGYEADEIGNRGTAGQQGFFIDQVIVTGGKLRLSRAKYKQELTQVEWQAAAQQYRVLNGVRMGFWKLVAMQRLIEVRTELLKINLDAVKTLEELVNVGQANKADLLQGRIEARQEKLALDNARVHLDAAWKQLSAFIGMPQLSYTPLQGDLQQAGTLPGFEATLDHILQASPEMQFAHAEIMRSQLGLERERVEPIPNLRARLGTQYNFESKNQQALVQIGITLPLFDRNQGNIRVAAAQVARSHAEVHRVELSLRKRLADAYGRYTTAGNKVETYRKEILPDAREAFALYFDAFQKRRAAYPQVLIAQRNYFQVMAEYVEALEQYRRAEVLIQGLLLSDGLEEPPGPPSEGGRINGRTEEANGPIGANGRGLQNGAGSRPAD